MSKFLDNTGLQYFWGKIKGYINTSLDTRSDELKPTVYETSLAPSIWSNNSVTLNVPNLEGTTDMVIWVTPQNQASAKVWAEAGVYCSGGDDGVFEFTCETTPTSNIGIYIVVLEPSDYITVSPSA